jgi:two-component system OmpR family response regulator
MSVSQTENQPHILIVDDERDIREPLMRYFNQHGMRASMAADGREMDQKLATGNIDLIILDVMMPGEDGLSICRRLQSTTQIPTILLTALVEETDRIVGLEMGADDYVTKPFSPRELFARVKSVLRRHQQLPKNKKIARGLVTFEGWKFDFSAKELIDAKGVAIRLSSGEHMMLMTLIEYAGMTLSRDQLLDLTKGREAQLYDRSIDNQVSRLRQKLETDPANPKIILTKWGGGYVFAAEVDWE